MLHGLLVLLLLSACGGGDDKRSGSPDPDLIAAARAGDADRVRSLLATGADVHFRDADGATALVAAACGNHLDAARELIEAGGDVNAKDETQQSAYLIATSEVGDDPRLLELTLTNGADVVRLLVGAGADVELADGQGATPLAHARREGFEEIAAILERAGARAT